MVQFSYFLSVIPSPWLKKNLRCDILQNDSILLLSINHSFTVVEENFEICHSEKLQNGSILLLSINHSFTVVEENFEI
jgi:hypothetical protein